jgi:hypothetical protein
MTADVFSGLFRNHGVLETVPLRGAEETGNDTGERPMYKFVIRQAPEQQSRKNKWAHSKCQL